MIAGQPWRRVIFAAIGAWALGCSLAAGAAEVVPIVWSAQQRFDVSRTIPAGQVLEVCGALAKGQGVEWRFKADQAVAFNIHHHVGKQVFYAARRGKTRGLTQRFVPEQATDYCWMWTAPPQAAVQLTLSLRY